MRLQGKVAIITGAGRGLGRAAAVAMAAEGASVAVLSRTAAEIEETARLIGRNVVHLTADVSRPEDVRRTVEKTLSAFGRVDVLMNNASVIGPVGATHQVDPREWEESLRINLFGVMEFARAVVPHMLERRSGKVINVTSGLGAMVMPPLGAYSVAKAGVIHLTRIMAEELRPYGIQANGLDPGVVDTRMQEDLRRMGPEVLGQEVHAEFMALKESGRLSPPEKAARLAVFLASPDSDGITGENGTERDYTHLGYRPGGKA